MATRARTTRTPGRRRHPNRSAEALIDVYAFLWLARRLGRILGTEARYRLQHRRR